MVQQQQLQLPAQRDPIARLAPFALGSAALWLAVVTPTAPADVQAQVLATPAPIIVIATPTAAPVGPTTAPAAQLVAPTMAIPTELPPPPPTAEPQVIVVEVTPLPTEAPPEPTTPPVPANQTTASGVQIVPTATMTRDEFIASFGPTPEPNAKCAFIGCLPKP